MMCFKDRTYCALSNSCRNLKCDRRFSNQDHLDATRWWGGEDYPLAINDFKTEDCGYKPMVGREDDSR